MTAREKFRLAASSTNPVIGSRRSSHRQHSLLGLRRFRPLVVDDRIGGRLGLALLLLVHFIPEADPIDAQRTPLNARRLGPFGLVPLAEGAAQRVVGRLFFIRHVFDRNAELAVLVRLQRYVVIAEIQVARVVEDHAVAQGSPLLAILGPGDMHRPLEIIELCDEAQPFGGPCILVEPRVDFDGFSLFLQ